MKIAELFVSLGFKTDGPDVIPTIDRNLGKAQISALGLLAAVTALNAAFYAMMGRGINAAVGLQRFNLETGQSTDELQKWQSAAVRVNAGANTIADAIKNIQKARSEIALGNVDASSPWFMLGIDPSADPGKVLNKLRDAIGKMDPGLARNFMGKMGFSDDLLFLLKQKQTLGTLFVTEREISQLATLGGAWRGFIFNLGTIATKFAAVFADQLRGLVGWLEKGALQMERFVKWITSGTPGANAFRNALFGIVIAMGAALVILTLFVGLLGVLKGLFIAIQLIPVVAALTAFVGLLALMAAGIAVVILLIQDFWTQLDGGKSFFDWNQNLILSIKNVERLAAGIQWMLDLMKELKNSPVQASYFTQGMMKEAVSYGSGFGFMRDFAKWNWKGGSSGNQQTNNVEVNIHAQGDAAAIGREAGSSVRREISDAWGMIPLPTT